MLRQTREAVKKKRNRAKARRQIPRRNRLVTWDAFAGAVLAQLKTQLQVDSRVVAAICSRR